MTDAERIAELEAKVAALQETLKKWKDDVLVCFMANDLVESRADKIVGLAYEMQQYALQAAKHRPILPGDE